MGFSILRNQSSYFHQAEMLRSNGRLYGFFIVSEVIGSFIHLLKLQCYYIQPATYNLSLPTVAINGFHAVRVGCS
ncbi:hypothetical protein PM082_003611 [Marasmius tenuissimus]|nr:hypothetical protein PM082_003611 [Marasmius tenuissimus]